MCFNPHTHAGCDFIPRQKYNGSWFQSTHPRRVWQAWCEQCADRRGFNPHTHAGCDWRLLQRLLRLLCFNPHTHAGCDYTLPDSSKVWMQFQSTHPRRVWRRDAFKHIHSFCFNPHTHAGCDVVVKSNCTICTCFNPHTHAGCDPFLVLNFRTKKVSIHTPTQGVTKRFFIKFCLFCFNPHTHAGCDLICTTKISFFFFVSIHTPTQGVTPFLVLNFRTKKVSIHTPTQGVTLYLITYYKSANLIHCYANHHYYSTS